MGESDSNIVEYAEDILYLFNDLVDKQQRQVLLEELL